MNRRVIVVVLGFVLVVSACAQPSDTGQGDVATTSSVAVETITSTTQTVTPATAAPEVSTSTTEAETWIQIGEEIPAPSESAELGALKAAFALSADVASGRMEGSIEMFGVVGPAGATDLVIPFGGAFDNESGDFSFSMDLSGAMAAAGDQLPPEFAALMGEMELRQIGETSFMKFPFFTQMLGADTPWISMPADQDDATNGFTMTSPVNPSEILGSFEDAGATVEVIGRETVNGTEATHYRAVFDTETLLAQASPEEREQLESQGPLPTEALPMDVWISDDGLVIRFVMEIDGDSFDAGPDEQFDRMLMRYDMFDLNEQITIEPPPASEVTDLSDEFNSIGIFESL